MPANQAFFDAIRPLFGGRLAQHQVEGMEKIIEYGEKWGYDIPDLAYVLATIKHETANWMQPIREGAHRFGPSYSDASAKRAVASIHAKGIIRTNYALPAGPYKQSYYGRGLVQITWYDNYKKFTDILGVPLDQKPDLALDWQNSLDIVFLGMRDGEFTGKKLSDFNLPLEYKKARVIVNGDSSKRWGGSERIDDRLARYARTFEVALRAASLSPVGETAPEPETPVQRPAARPSVDLRPADAPTVQKATEKPEEKSGWEWLWPF